MIHRIWHGWATPDKADAYESLLKDEIFPAIIGRRIPGFASLELLRRNVGSEVEFVTILQFESIEAVKAFAGDDYEAAVVSPQARALLSRFDERSSHYELRTTGHPLQD